MYPHTPLLALALIVSLAGCSADTIPPAAPFEPEVPVPPAPSVGPVAKVLFHNLDSTFILGGSRQELAVFVLDANGKAVPNKLVVWSSDKPLVAAVATQGTCGPTAVPGCYRTTVNARDEGIAVITATVDGVSAQVTVRVGVALAEASGIAVDFSVVELAGPSYAPLMTVTETTGKRTIEILAVGIRLPGWVFEIRCAGAVVIGPGSAVPMFPSFYGEHGLVISRGPPTTSDEAVATVYLRDQSGALFKKDVTGKISSTYVLPPQESTHSAYWQCG